MKSFGKLASLLIILSILVVLTACAGTPKSSGQDSGTSIPSEAAVSEEVSEELPPPDASLTDESILGEWTSIVDATRFAKITKNGSEYQYQDPEGTYTGTFDKGVLKVKVNETETAEVYFDAKSENLLTVYQGAAERFKK